MNLNIKFKHWTFTTDSSSRPLLCNMKNSSNWTSVFPFIGIGVHSASQNQLRCEYFNKQTDKSRVLLQNNQLVLLEISFEEFGVKLNLKISQNSEKLSITIPENGIIENNEQMYRLAWIDILPGLGASKRKTEGYVFIPSSQGVLHYFDENQRKLPKPDISNAHSVFAYQSPWGNTGGEFHCRKKIFGSFQNENQWEAQVPMPFAGIVKSQNSLMLTVEKGEMYAEYHFAADAGPERLIWIDFRLHYRNKFESIADSCERIISYQSNSCEKCFWQKMSHIYRSFLIESNKLLILKERAEKSTELKRFIKHSQIRAHFGNKAPEPNGNGEMLIRINYNELNEVICRLHKKGLDKCQLTCVGFNKGGHDGYYPTIFPLCTAFGSNADFYDLMEKAKSMDWRFSFHLQFWDSFKISPDFSSDNLIIQENQVPLTGGLWAGGLSYILCPAAAEKFIKKTLPKMKEIGFEGIAYLDAALSYIEECHNKQHPLNRREFINKYNDNIAYAAKLFSGVQNELGLSCTLGLVDYILCAPRDERNANTQLRESQLYGNGYVHEFVPAWDMVAHGLTPYNVYRLDYSDSEKWNTYILDSARRGALPEMPIESGIPNKEAFLNLIKTYNLIKDVFSKLQYEIFQDYSELQPGVYESIFGNKKIITNYLGHAVEEDGKIIAAKSFECFEF